MMKSALLVLPLFFASSVFGQLVQFPQPVKDSSGKYAYRVTDYTYENAHPFNWYDHAAVKQDGKWYMIDHEYDIISPAADSIDIDFFYRQGDYLRSQLLLQNGRWILFDPRKYRHSPQFTAVRKQFFNDDALLVEVDDKKVALLDLTRFSLSAPFDSLLHSPNDNPYAVFWGRTGNQILRIDTRPKKTRTDTFDLVTHLNSLWDGRFAYRRNGLWNVRYDGGDKIKNGIPEEDFFIIPYEDIVVFRRGGNLYVQDIHVYSFVKVNFPSVAPRVESDDAEGLWNIYINIDSTRMLFKREKYGFMDRFLNITISPQFDDAHPFEGHDLTAAKKDGAWGIIDREGRFVVPAEYDTLLRLPHGDFAAQKNGKYGIIDTRGEVVYPFRFTELRRKNHDFFATADGKTGLIDYTFKELIPLQYTSLKSLGNGWFMYKKDSLTGIYDLATRTELFEGKYHDLEREGNFVLHKRDDSRNGLLTSSGKRLLPDTFASMDGLGGGFFKIMPQDDFDREYYYQIYDANNDKVLPGQYDWTGEFSEGMLAVSNGGKRGYINKQGLLVIPFRYRYAGKFQGGKASVSQGAKSFYIDVNGQKVSNKKVP